MILMNLFGMFDPSSYFGISLNWVISLMVLMAFPLKYYICYSDLMLVFMNFKSIMNHMFKEISGNNYHVLIYMCTVTFIYLMVCNLLSLFPFIFTSTAHPAVTMSMGTVLWMSFFLMGWLKNFKESAAHLVPEGSPLGLAPLMVLIESISHLIRPFTLSVRLAANMMAGHLIISLLSSISLINFFGFFFSFLFQSLLLMLEVAVAIIQGFVFSILLMLYALEYY